jgi:hypothetical protein
MRGIIFLTIKILYQYLGKYCLVNIRIFLWKAQHIISIEQKRDIGTANESDQPHIFLDL